MPSHAPDIMSASFFAQKVKLHKKKGKFSIKGRRPHPLKVIHTTLSGYHGMAKSQVVSRHRLLDQLVRDANNYIRGKDPTRTHSEKVQTVAILAWQCNQRLTTEQQRAKQLANRINHVPQRGAQIHGGLRFERIAKPGQLNVTGGDLLHHAQQGNLGNIELTGNDEVDYYAMKKLLKTLTPEKLRLAGIKALEYSSDTQRAKYATEIDATKMTWTESGARVHTLNHQSGEVPGFAHYAADLDGHIFVRTVDHAEMGRFAHSSFLSGNNALCAGTVSVDQGRIVEITNESGHYRPTAANLADVCKAILEEGYDPREDSYALLTDFAGELQPMGRYGRYRVPMELFAQHDGIPPDHLDFEVERMADGLHRYVDPEAAAARDCSWITSGERTESAAAGCLDGFNWCAGPRYHAHRLLGIQVCPYCENYAQIARVQGREEKRIRTIRQLSGRNDIKMHSKNRSMSDMACQMIVDLLWECGIDNGAPAKCAFLVCGSIARGESSTYSDIDAVLVLENDAGGTHTFYERVINDMNSLLLRTGLNETGFGFCPGGLSPKDSMMHAGLRGTPDEILTLINHQMATDPDNAAHLLGAMHTKLIFGDANVARQYQDACARQIDTSRSLTKARAVQEMASFAQKMRTGDWKIPTGNELYIKVKDQLYRPAHMIIHALSQYYGIHAVSARDQLQALVDQKHMSREIANMMRELLDVAGQMRMNLQLRQGQEFEVLKLRTSGPMDNFDSAELVNGLALAPQRELQNIRQMIPTLKILAGLTEVFVSRKGRHGVHRRKNPFMTDRPGSFAI